MREGKENERERENSVSFQININEIRRKKKPQKSQEKMESLIMEIESQDDKRGKTLSTESLDKQNDPYLDLQYKQVTHTLLLMWEKDKWPDLADPATTERERM